MCSSDLAGGRLRAEPAVSTQSHEPSDRWNLARSTAVAALAPSVVAGWLRLERRWSLSEPLLAQRPPALVKRRSALAKPPRAAPLRLKPSGGGLWARSTWQAGEWSRASRRTRASNTRGSSSWYSTIRKNGIRTSHSRFRKSCSCRSLIRIRRNRNCNRRTYRNCHRFRTCYSHIRIPRSKPWSARTRRRKARNSWNKFRSIGHERLAKLQRQGLRHSPKQAGSIEGLVSSDGSFLRCWLRRFPPFDRRTHCRPVANRSCSDYRVFSQLVGAVPQVA